MAKPSHVKYTFSAGELDPELEGRTDLERYDFAARTMKNALPRYSGGAFKRPGSEFAEYLQNPGKTFRLFPFTYSQDAQNSYLVIVGNGWIRLMQDGAYVLDDDVAALQVLQGVVEAPSHGYSNGDLVYHSGYTNIFIVSQKSTDYFQMLRVDGATFTPDILAPGTLNRVTTLDHPYSQDELAGLSYESYLDAAKITTLDHPPYVLTRTESGWSFEEESFARAKPLGGQSPDLVDSKSYVIDIQVMDDGTGYDPKVDTLTWSGGGADAKGLKMTPTWESTEIRSVAVVEGGSGFNAAPTIGITTSGGSDASFKVEIAKREAGVAATVTAVYSDGTESGPMRPKIKRNIINYTQTEGWLEISWNEVEGAVSYNVYRSVIVPDGEKIHIGFAMGYIGSSLGTTFTDPNITPDFTRQPRTFLNPFANGAVLSIEVTNGGSGYGDNDDLTMTGGDGTQFVGWPVVQDGEIIGVFIADPGKEYTSPALNVTTSGGSGASFDITLSEDAGLNPQVSVIHQNRQYYMGTTEKPLTFWGSKVGELDAFSYSTQVVADDPFEYRLDTSVVTPIKHAVSAQNGMLIFTDKDVRLIRGSDNKAITADENPQNDAVSFVGCGDVKPSRVEADIIYVNSVSRGMQLIQYGQGYSTQEISIMSRHLFEGSKVKALAFAHDTDKIGYGVFEDGTAFAVTINRAERTFGFSRITTQGKYVDVAVVNVGTEEHVYFGVERVWDNTTWKMIEVVKPRDSDDPEDYIHLDGFTRTEKTFPDERITMSGVTGVITVTAAGTVFTADDVDKAFVAGGGRGVITAWNSGTEIEVTLTRDVVKRSVHDSTQAAEMESGDWWIAPYVTTVTRVPFEDATVSIVGDGKQLDDAVVDNGVVELSQPAAAVAVGFGYDLEVTTLPLISHNDQLSGRVVNVFECKAMVRNAGAFEIDGYGSDYRVDEAWGEPTRLAQRTHYITVNTGWNDEGSVTLTQSNGLPFELIQMTMVYDAGD